MNGTILVLEDEPAVADVIEFSLKKAGFAPCVVGGVQAAKTRLGEGTFGAAILDLGLPDGDGLDLCRWLRTHPEALLRSIPLIMVTCRDEETDRVLGLELGADDYVVKPFSPRELIARLSSLLRRANNGYETLQPLVHLGALSLNRLSFEAKINGEILPLTRTEFELLWTIVGSPERVYSRQLLVEQAYDGSFVSDRTIDSHIKTIRQKCGSVKAGFNPIQTVYGVGYRAKLP